MFHGEMVQLDECDCEDCLIAVTSWQHRPSWRAAEPRPTRWVLGIVDKTSGDVVMGLEHARPESFTPIEERA